MSGSVCKDFLEHRGSLTEATLFKASASFNKHTIENIHKKIPAGEPAGILCGNQWS